MKKLLFASFLCACETTSPCAAVRCGDGHVCSDDDGLCHCGGGASCAAGEVCEAGACVPQLPDPICGDGTEWAAGEAAFVEATDAWGLSGVEGVRLTVTDVDGDGWADLEIRRGPHGIDDFSSNATRFTWLLRNTGDGAFEDITERSGLLARRNGEGGRPIQIVAWGDVDNDGDLDVYTGVTTEMPVGDETSELLLNDGSGRFTLTDAANAVRRADMVDIPGGASFTDVDRDGLLDLWIPQHNGSNTFGIRPYQSRLFRGDGAGLFADATFELGLTAEAWGDNDTLNAGLSHPRAWSAAACDLNGDGWPELLAASYGRAPNHLWQSREGVYENRSVASGYAYDDRMDWTDNQFARCYCQANRVAEGCAEVPAPLISCGTPNWNHDTDREPWRLGGNSAATICADIDNDGDIDLLTTEIKHWWAGENADGSEVLLNDGGADPVFSRPGDAALGLAIDHSASPSWDEGHMTAAVFDFDLDGRPDIYIGGSDYAGNRGLLYHQASDSFSFVEVPPSEGIDHNRSHGVVFADFDRDGDLDVVVGHSRARCDPSLPNDCYATGQVRFFENVAGDGGNFVQLALEGGEGANRSAIGARVRVTAGGTTQTQEISGGHGHYGAQNDLVLTFGLGAACEADVEIRWPDAIGTTESFTLPAGHRFEIAQGGRPVLAR